MRWTTALLGIAVAQCCVVTAAANAGGPRARRVDADAVSARPQRLRGYGAVAIRQGASLYVVDGDAPRALRFRVVERGRSVRSMLWSHDGTWLAYATTDGALWLVSRNGSHARRVALAVAVAADDRFTWSPRANVLLVSQSRRVACPIGCPPAGPRRTPLYDSGRVTLVTPPATVRRLSGDATAANVGWSISGRNVTSLVFNGTLPFAQWNVSRQAVFTSRVRADGSFSSPVARIASSSGGQVAFGAFVPHGNGMLYWSGDELSASAAADGQQLFVQRFAHAASQQLVTMVPRASWLSFSGDGTRVVVVRGGGREAWHTKSLAVCRLVERVGCRSLPQPAATVSLDPRWAPAGDRIAFVRANDLGANGGYGQGTFFGKYVSARELWMADAEGSPGRPLTKFGRGVYWPRWSRDGRRLMVFRSRALWIGDPDGALLGRVAGGLPDPPDAHDHGTVSDDDAPFAWTGG